MKLTTHTVRIANYGPSTLSLYPNTPEDHFQIEIDKDLDAIKVADLGADARDDPETWYTSGSISWDWRNYQGDKGAILAVTYSGDLKSWLNMQRRIQPLVEKWITKYGGKIYNYGDSQELPSPRNPRSKTITGDLVQVLFPQHKIWAESHLDPLY
jgi:hypothetical protein